MPIFRCPMCMRSPCFVSKLILTGECDICARVVDRFWVFGPCGHPVCVGCFDRICSSSEDQPGVMDLREAYCRRRYRAIEDVVMGDADSVILPMPGEVTPPPPTRSDEPPPAPRPGLRPKAKARPPRLPQLAGQAWPSSDTTPSQWTAYYYEALAGAAWFGWEGQLCQWAYESQIFMRPVLVRRATRGVSLMQVRGPVPPFLNWVHQSIFGSSF